MPTDISSPVPGASLTALWERSSQCNLCFFAVFFATAAFIISLITLYNTYLSGPQVDLSVASKIYYHDIKNAQSKREAIVVPITISNNGAKSTVIPHFSLKITHPTKKIQTEFCAVGTGHWDVKTNPLFTPVTVSGYSTFSIMVRFSSCNSTTKMPEFPIIAPAVFNAQLNAKLAAPRNTSIWQLLQDRMEQKIVDFKLETNPGNVTKFKDTGFMYFQVVPNVPTDGSSQNPITSN